MGRRALRPIDPALDLGRYLLLDEDVPDSWTPLEFFPSGPPAMHEHLTPENRREAASRPLEIDVGCGKGMFLADAAEFQPGRNFLGIELRRKYARYSASRLARRKLANAVVFQADAERFLAEKLPPESIAAVHVYFPDPWWKARHKKRRIMNPRFLASVERVLAPAGCLHFWTDVEEYFHVAVATVEQSTELHGPLGVAERAPEHDMDYQTNFERRKRMLGLPIFRSRFIKPDMPATGGKLP